MNFIRGIFEKLTPIDPVFFYPILTPTKIADILKRVTQARFVQ